MVVNSEWICKKITDDKFKTVIKEIGTFDINNGPWIAGGCIRKLWQNLEWNDQDIDIFFRTKTQYDSFTNNVNNLNKRKNSTVDLFSNPVEIFPSPVDFISSSVEKYISESNSKCYFVFDHESRNARTYIATINDKINGNNLFKVQTISRFFPDSVIKLLEDFDWTICQFVSDGKFIWATPDAIDGLNKNELILSLTSKKIISPLRLIKYLSYGFDADNSIILNVMKYLNENPLREDDADDY